MQSNYSFSLRKLKSIQSLQKLKNAYLRYIIVKTEKNFR
jgi:hypothetical protein